MEAGTSSLVSLRSHTPAIVGSALIVAVKASACASTESAWMTAASGVPSACARETSKTDMLLEEVDALARFKQKYETECKIALVCGN